MPNTPENEPDEELDPLFDYSSVQPECLFIDDDDDDTVAIFSGAKRKRGGGVDIKGKGAESVVINLDDDDGNGNKKDEDDEDWLAPPPRIANTGLMFREDKTIQELRLKKQELASIAQSAKDVLRAVMESEKKEIGNSTKPEMEPKVVPPPEKQVARAKIVISIQDKDGQRQFRIYSNDTFERLFKMYADKAKVELDKLVFSFDGDKVRPDATPEGLGMENDDMLEVHVKSQ